MKDKVENAEKEVICVHTYIQLYSHAQMYMVLANINIMALSITCIIHHWVIRHVIIHCNSIYRLLKRHPRRLLFSV